MFQRAAPVQNISRVSDAKVIANNVMIQSYVFVRTKIVLGSLTER